MIRIGPNQDINDPTTIIDLAYQYQQQSDVKGNLLAQSIAQNPNVTGSPIIDISIPFKMINGSIQLLHGINIDYDSGYIYNSGLVNNAHIGTYINLAERFRVYWETLNNVLNQLNNYNYLQETDIDPEGPIIVSGLGSGIIRIHGSLGGTEYTKSSYSYSPATSLSIPEWIGNGTTNYNQLTYPQLLTELQQIDIQISSSQIVWDTRYWYDKYSDSGGSVRGVSASFGKDEDYVPPLNQQYIQIYNSNENTINISLTINISATFDSRFSTSYASWAEIDDINSYPDPFGGFKYLLSSYVSYSEEKLSPGGTIALNTSRTIEIPSGKSAFIGCVAGAGTTFGDIISIGTVNITLVLNEKTLTHSANVI